MNDAKTTCQDLKDFMKQFVHEREWEQFHIPKNLSISLALEAAEIMELFQWCDNTESWEIAKNKRTELEEELADVLSYLLAFANACNIDLSKAYARKMALNAQKYPIEKSKGRSDKYTTYTD